MSLEERNRLVDALELAVFREGARILKQVRECVCCVLCDVYVCLCVCFVCFGYFVLTGKIIKEKISAEKKEEGKEGKIEKNNSVCEKTKREVWRTRRLAQGVCGNIERSSQPVMIKKGR